MHVFVCGRMRAVSMHIGTAVSLHTRMYACICACTYAFSCVRACIIRTFGTRSYVNTSMYDAVRIFLY